MTNNCESIHYITSITCSFSSGYFINEAFAEVSENQAFLLEGSGFAVTEDVIETSEIDIGLSSQDRRGKHNQLCN